MCASRLHSAHERVSLAVSVSTSTDRPERAGSLSGTRDTGLANRPTGPVGVPKPEGASAGDEHPRACLRDPLRVRDAPSRAASTTTVPYYPAGGLFLPSAMACFSLLL